MSLFKNIHLWTLLFSMIVVGMVSVHLGQDVNWDLLNYHYYNGYAFFHLPIDQDFLAVNIQSYFNPFVDAMNYLLITYLPPKLMGFSLGMIQGINFYLLGVVATQVIPNSYSPIAKTITASAIALLGLLSASAIGEIGTTFNDLTVTNGILLSILIIIVALQEDSTVQRKWIWFLTAGFCLGASTALKLTMSIYAVGAVLAFVVVNRSLAGKFQLIALLIAGETIGFLALNGYQMYLLWEHFSNPVFPLYNGIFKSPNYFLINPSVDIFFPRNWLQTWFYPFYFSWKDLTSEAAFRDFRLACVYLLFVVYLIKIMLTQKRESEIKKYIITFFVFSYLLWQYQFSVQRYAMVLDIMAPLLIFIFLTYILNNVRKVNRWGMVIFLLLVATTKPPHWGRLPWGTNYFNVKLSKEINLKTKSIVFAYFPTGFIRSSFPDDWHFIGLYGTGSDWPYLNEFLNKIPQADQYPWYVLFPNLKNDQLMQIYGFEVIAPCQQIKTKSLVLSLCEINHR